MNIQGFVIAAFAGAWVLGCASSSSGLHPESAGDPQRLHDTEVALCTDVPQADRDLGPLGHRDRIAGLEVLQDRVYVKQMLQPAGAAIYVRATPGMTEQWLNRTLECYLAHHAAIAGNDADPHDPLFVRDARIGLSPTGDGFRISITTKDVAAARDIIDRARIVVSDSHAPFTVARKGE